MGFFLRGSYGPFPPALRVLLTSCELVAFCLRFAPPMGVCGCVKRPPLSRFREQGTYCFGNMPGNPAPPTHFTWRPEDLVIFVLPVTTQVGPRLGCAPALPRVGENHAMKSPHGDGGEMPLVPLSVAGTDQGQGHKKPTHRHDLGPDGKDIFFAALGGPARDPHYWSGSHGENGRAFMRNRPLRVGPLGPLHFCPRCASVAV